MCLTGITVLHATQTGTRSKRLLVQLLGQLRYLTVLCVSSPASITHKAHNILHKINGAYQKQKIQMSISFSVFSLAPVSFIFLKINWGGVGVGRGRAEPLNIRTFWNYVVQETNFYPSLLPQITDVYIHYKNIVGQDAWHLNKIDTYYKSVKRSFYWNNWVTRSFYLQLKKTGKLHFCSLVFR